MKNYFDSEEILNTGGLVVLPTDTIYGILALAHDKKAVENLYKVRRRDPKKACIVLIARPEDLKKFGAVLSAERFRQIKKIWRSSRPTSIVVPLKASVIKKYKYLHRGQKTLAFRVPSTRSERGRALRKLIEKTGPLVAPSANPEGKQPATTVTEAREYFGNQVAAYISAGRKLEGLASRVISFAENDKKILR